MAFSERRDSKDDWYWERVDTINSYAVLMGYLSMAIKGLGYLVLTWTTVVLLGGFVSTLHKNDFWSLTFITLVQTAGIFDVVLNEKLSKVMHAISGLLETVFRGVTGSPDLNLVSPARFLLACIVVVVQVLLLVAVLCPLAIIYVFGILMSGGISVWRLKEHDYRGSDEEVSNLPSAMNTLYYLALIQCELFCYRYVLSCMGKRLASTCDDLETQIFSRYLRETQKGCEKDPSFAEGRGLSMHAIHMIRSKSPVDCIHGVEMLYTSICCVEREMKFLMQKNTPESLLIEEEFVIAMKQFVRAATSSGKVLQKLLEMLDPIGLHYRETRNQATKIVECLASNINLEQFPRGIHYISSLIGTFQEYGLAQASQQRRDPRGELVQDYKELLVRGLCIIRELASSENNCRVIRDTQDLVSKIIAPVTSDLLHHTSDDHGEWSNIVDVSVEVMCRLTGAPGETGAKLRREISSCKEAVRTLWRILRCNKCGEELQRRAIQILTRLYMDTESREDFVRRLVDIFTQDYTYSNSIREYAGETLSEICLHGAISDATVVIQTGGGDAVDGLAIVLVHDRNEICRQEAAEILKHLCTHYTKDDEYLGKLKKSILKVLGETLGCGKEADIENQRDNEEGQGISALVQSVRSATFLPSLLSLCWTVYDKFKGELAPDLALEFDASSFVSKLNEMDITDEVEKLLLFKAIGEVVILMMRRSDRRFVKQEDLKSFMKALSAASKGMLDIDYSMVFSSANSCSATMSSKRNRRTLASIVKEAEELHASWPSTSVSG